MSDASPPTPVNDEFLDLCEGIGHPCQGGMDRPQVARLGGRWVHCTNLATGRVVQGDGAPYVCDEHTEEAVERARKEGAHYPFPLVEPVKPLASIVRHWPEVVARALRRVESEAAKVTP